MKFGPDILGAQRMNPDHNKNCHFFGSESNIWTIGWVAMKFGTHNHTQYNV